MGPGARLDAVVAAPAHHKVLFESDNLRVLEATLAPDEEEPVHHHQWRSIFVLDQVQGPIHDIAPDGHSRRRIGMSSRLYKHGTVMDAWSLI
jgi:hypothetical protein